MANAFHYIINAVTGYLGGTSKLVGISLLAKLVHKLCVNVALDLLDRWGDKI
jgi:hypothetical protein